MKTSAVAPENGSPDFKRPGIHAATPHQQRELHDCRADLLMAHRQVRELEGQLQATREALSASRSSEQAAQHDARHDALTGLPNRRAFDLRAQSALRRHASQARLLCVAFFDLDGFKAINDGWGHAAGDALLRGVGERLTRALRRDDFVCRLGGDEFVCLLPNLKHEDQAIALGRKLVAAIGAPSPLGGQTLRVQASAGLALYPRDGQTLADLMERADQAMLQAKCRAPSSPSGRGAVDQHLQRALG